MNPSREKPVVLQRSQTRAAGKHFNSPLELRASQQVAVGDEA